MERKTNNNILNIKIMEMESIRTQSEKLKDTESIEVMYSELMETFEPSPYIGQEWPMKDGLYQQYSSFRDDVPCIAGTSSLFNIL